MMWIFIIICCFVHSSSSFEMSILRATTSKNSEKSVNPSIPSCAYSILVCRRDTVLIFERLTLAGTTIRAHLYRVSFDKHFLNLLGFSSEESLCSSAEYCCFIASSSTHLSASLCSCDGKLSISWISIWTKYSSSGALGWVRLIVNFFGCPSFGLLYVFLKMSKSWSWL